MENYSQVDCSCSLINVSYKIKNTPQSLHQPNPRSSHASSKKPAKKTKVSLSRSFSGLNQYQLNSRVSQNSNPAKSTSFKPQQYRKCNIYTNTTNVNTDKIQKPSSILSINVKNNTQPSTKLRKKCFNPSSYKFGDLQKTKNTTFDNSLQYSQSNKSKIINTNPQFYQTFSFYNRNNANQSQYKKHLTRNSQIKQLHPSSQNSKPRSIVIPTPEPSSQLIQNWSTFPQQVRRIKTLKELDCRNAQSSGSAGASHTSENHISMIMSVSQDNDNDYGNNNNHDHSKKCWYVNGNQIGKKDQLRELNRLARKSMGGEDRRWGYKTQHCFN